MAINPGQPKPVPTFPPRPHIIPPGSTARENMRDAAERNINDVRTRTRTNFVLIMDLMRPSVNRWSSLTHGSHCTITSWPAAATQTRPRLSKAMQPNVFLHRLLFRLQPALFPGCIFTYHTTFYFTHNA